MDPVSLGNITHIGKKMQQIFCFVYWEVQYVEQAQKNGSVRLTFQDTHIRIQHTEGSVLKISTKIATIWWNKMIISTEHAKLKSC